MSISEKLNYISYKNNIPLFVSIEITRKCNLSCRHCYLVETHTKKLKKEELTTNEIFKILKELKELNTMFVNITGGEPFLREDLEDIIKKAIEENFYVKLFSSFSIATKERIKKLYDLGLRDVDVSLYGRKDIHNYITCSNLFSKTVENILYARSLGYNITIKTPIMQKNYSEISYLEKFSKAFDLKFRLDPIITPLNDGSKNKVKSISYKDICYILSRFLDIKEDNTNNCEKYDFYTSCGALRNVIGITSYGEVYPCIAYPKSIGNIRRNSLKKILFSNKANELRQRLLIEDKKCIECNYYFYCTRCPGISYLLYKNALRPYKMACNLAKEFSYIK